MGEPRTYECRTCERTLRPETLGHSRYARSLPMCEDCEEQALREVRPSPQDRKQRPDRTRYGAHAPDEYYIIESADPKIQGFDGAVMSFVEYLYELAK